MDYQGRYDIFDLSRIRTYPLKTRANKVTLNDLIRPEEIDDLAITVSEGIRRDVETVAQAMIAARQANQPVILFTGAHLIKNGLGPLLADLVKRRLVSLVAGNGATAIHDFELALIGETSENVPNALGKGRFGMAYEFAYFNEALALGEQLKLGCGESLGRMMCDEAFRDRILARVVKEDSPTGFAHPEVSVLATCYERAVPFTVHVGIGTDVIDQHPSFDGPVKGGCSGRDFLIYAQEISRLTEGGVVLNIGSAVTGPEVLLKAVSMAANAGNVPKHIITADFDLRHHDAHAMTDEAAQGYYYRDQKSIVTRIPEAFDGKGHYLLGNQKQTFPLLYKRLMEKS